MSLVSLNKDGDLEIKHLVIHVHVVCGDVALNSYP